MDERITQYVDLVAAASTSDPELRLLLRAQAVSRITGRTHVYLSAGNGWEESMDSVLREFGPPERLAAELLRANAERIKGRARMRRLLWLLLPAVLLVYGMIQYTACGRMSHAMRILAYMKTDGSDPSLLSAALSSYFPFQPTKLRQAEFLLFGDRTRPSEAEQRRAIWEAHPGNKAYFANYVGYLVKAGIHSRQDLAHFRAELQPGMKLDPDNALYHYLLADALAGQALEHYDDKWTADMKPGVLHYPYRVNDRPLLEEAIGEVRAGLARHDLMTYHQEMLQSELALLPTPRYWEDYELRLIVGANILLPEQAHFRSLACATPYFAHVLAVEGRKHEAEALLRGWLPMSKQLIGNSRMLMEILVARLAAEEVGLGAAREYDELGEQAQARQIRARVARICEPYYTFRASINDNQSTRDLLYKYGALHTCPLIPIFGKQSFSIPELAPTRNLEFVMMELLIASIIPTVLLIMLLYAVLVGLRWSWCSEDEATVPFLALLPAKTIWRVLGYAVLLPLVLYYLHTRWSGLAGREYGIFASLCLVPVEIIALAFVLLILPARMAKRAIRRHCEELGMPLPPRGYQRFRGFLSGAWAVIWVVLFWGMGIVGTTAAVVLLLLGKFSGEYLLPLIVTVLLVGGTLLPGLLKWRHPYGQYYGTVAKTLVPLYALVLLLVSVLTLPYLSRSEQFWLRQDRLIYTRAGAINLPTPIEYRFVGTLREQMLSGMDEAVQGKVKGK